VTNSDAVAVRRHKAAVVINQSAGSLLRRQRHRQIDEICRTLEQRGYLVELLLPPRRRVTEAAHRAAATVIDLIVAGGGDGTIGGVARAAVRHDCLLGVLPLGTLNHFARDLGLPLDWKAAIDVIAAGHIRAVDIGEVNGHLFLNNSSLGLYPRLVIERETERLRHRIGKGLALLLAGMRVWKRFPTVSIQLETPRGTVARTTSIVFVGNNRYEVNLLRLGRRDQLDAGQLCLYLSNTPGRLATLKLVLHALIGRLNQARDFEIFCLDRFRIDTRSSVIHVALDGEVRRLKPPLEYTIRPKALRVLAPTESVDGGRDSV
jgi:diacylglycerol kinase family enzyme